MIQQYKFNLILEYWYHVLWFMKLDKIVISKLRGRKFNNVKEIENIVNKYMPKHLQLPTPYWLLKTIKYYDEI